MVPLLYPVLLFLLFACALAFPFHVLCRLPLFVGTLSVSHVFGASVVCSFPLGYFSLLNFFPFMVTNFNGNSKITLLPLTGGFQLRRRTVGGYPKADRL